MANTLDITRPKLDLTVSDTVTTIAGTVTESGNSTQTTYFLPVKLDNIDADSFTVAGCVTATSTALTTATPNGFADVEVGDVVTGTNIDTNTVVATKTSNTALVLDKPTTGTGSGITITFDPPTVDPTLYGVGVAIAVSGETVTITTTGYKYDGSLIGTTGTAANATSNKKLGTDTVNLDTFLDRLRVPRTNS